MQTLHGLMLNVSSLDESGELLGEHVWDAELLEETQGLFLMLSVCISLYSTPTFIQGAHHLSI